MAYRIANVGKTGILKVKKSNAEQVKYRPDLGDVDLDLSSELNTNTTGQFNTVTGGLMQSCVINLEPIQSGSGDPSPSNVRPITGHTAVEVGNVGKNLMPPEIEYTDGTHNYFKTSNDVLVKSGTYTASFFNGSSNSSKLLVNKVVGGTETTIANVTVNSNSRGSATVTLTDDTYIRIAGRFDPTSAISDLSIFSQIQLEKGTLTDYEPYNGKTYTISLGQTVYGGSHDVVSGVGSDEFIRIDLGSLNWNYDSDHTRFGSASVPSGIKPCANESVANAVCEIYSIESYINTYNGSDNNVIGVGASGGLIIRDTRYTDGNALKTALTGFYLVAEKATQTDITTAPQQIETLIGQNNISVPLEGQSLDSLNYREMMAWDDVNDVVNTRLPISAIGTDESNNDKASQAYSQGDYFYKNGIAKAKTSIAQGATFTLGTNYEIKTLAEILKALES